MRNILPIIKPYRIKELPYIDTNVKIELKPIILNRAWFNTIEVLGLPELPILYNDYGSENK